MCWQSFPQTETFRRQLILSLKSEIEMIKSFQIEATAAALLIGLTGLAQAAGDDAATFEIAPGVYSYTSGNHYHSMFVVTDDGVAAFETVNSKHSIAMLEAIRAVTDQPVKFALQTHNHWDHASGGGVMQEAGAKTVMHKLAAEWLEANPGDADLVRTDPLFVQRCTHETVRLQPSSPVAMRWALEDVELKSGLSIPEGAKVVIDLESVNRDQSIFGADAADFNPHRETPDGVPAYGLSFGSGMHACIGMDLAAGLLFHDDSTMDDHIFGLVPEAVQALFDHDPVPDPDDPARMDDSTTRPYFGHYPVLLRS